jgi:hypothetical protein
VERLARSALASSSRRHYARCVAGLAECRHRRSRPVFACPTCTHRRNPARLRRGLSPPGRERRQRRAADLPLRLPNRRADAASATVDAGRGRPGGSFHNPIRGRVRSRKRCALTCARRLIPDRALPNAEVGQLDIHR